jgi:hypothetical protein
VAAVTLGVVLVACSRASGDFSSAGRPSERSPAKNGTGELRTDLEPLVSRIPALSPATGATWLSGTLGDATVPGPSIYWIDAVVTLPEVTAQQLRVSLELGQATEGPEVVGALETSLPEGHLLAGAGLDEAFSADGWRSTAYLEAEGDRLVLVVVGE